MVIKAGLRPGSKVFFGALRALSGRVGPVGHTSGVSPFKTWVDCWHEEQGKGEDRDPHTNEKPR